MKVRTFQLDVYFADRNYVFYAFFAQGFAASVTKSTLMSFQSFQGNGIVKYIGVSIHSIFRKGSRF